MKEPAKENAELEELAKKHITADYEDIIAGEIPTKFGVST